MMGDLLELWPFETSTLLLAMVLVSVTAATLVLAHVWRTSKTLRDRMAKARSTPAQRRDWAEPPAFEAALDDVGRYYSRLRRGHLSDVEVRLLEAGFLSPRAPTGFALTRYAVALFCGVTALILAQVTGMGGSVAKLFLIVAAPLGIGYLAPSFLLDHLVNRRRRSYQRIFPDFIDMLVVCIEAGLTMEAAINRIAREYARSNRMFAVHLQIAMLEVRAGRKMRDALGALADRMSLPEARSLATLVRQSEELGASIGRSLRVHADEMRVRRMMRAEEIANELPVKMMLPIAVFLFPVTLGIVVAPVMITLMKVLAASAPG